MQCTTYNTIRPEYRIQICNAICDEQSPQDGGSSETADGQKKLKAH